MFDVKLTIGGRDVPLDRLGDELEKAFLSDMEEEMRRAVQRVYCSEHHEYARLTGSRSLGSDVEFTIKGCCQKVVDEAGRALR